jgi:hypothetical protein
MPHVQLLPTTERLLTIFRTRPARSRKTREEDGIMQYPRPDLLAAAGLAPGFQPETPLEEN